MASLTITQAMLARFAQSAVTDFTDSGGMWFEEVPSLTTPTLPLLGFAHNGQQCDYTSENQYIESGSFDIDIYALTIAEAERLGLVLKGVYDPCIRTPSLLDVTNAKVFEFKRDSDHTTSEGFATESGKQVGHVNIRYSYMVRRTLPS